MFNKDLAAIRFNTIKLEYVKVYNSLHKFNISKIISELYLNNVTDVYSEVYFLNDYLFTFFNDEDDFCIRSRLNIVCNTLDFISKHKDLI